MFNCASSRFILIQQFDSIFWFMKVTWRKISGDITLVAGDITLSEMTVRWLDQLPFMDIKNFLSWKDTCQTRFILNEKEKNIYIRWNSVVWSSRCMSVVLRRTVVSNGDWHFDNLSRSHYPSQVNSCCQSPDSDNEFCSDCRNVNYYNWQQSFSGVHLPGWLNYTITCYFQVQTIYRNI